MSESNLPEWEQLLSGLRCARRTAGQARVKQGLASFHLYPQSSGESALQQLEVQIGKPGPV
jgi:hypothetical protein